MFSRQSLFDLIYRNNCFIFTATLSRRDCAMETFGPLRSNVWFASLQLRHNTVSNRNYLLIYAEEYNSIITVNWVM